jgi:hypothetical protein
LKACTQALDGSLRNAVKTVGGKLFTIVHKPEVNRPSVRSRHWPRSRSPEWPGSKCQQMAGFALSTEEVRERQHLPLGLNERFEDHRRLGLGCALIHFPQPFLHPRQRITQIFRRFPRFVKQPV